MTIKPVTGPLVWDGKRLEQGDEWIDRWTGAEVDALLTALARVKSKGLAPEAMRRGDFEVPALRDRFVELGRELESGKGFLFVRGLPIEELSIDDCKLLFWGIGLQLGVPINQTRHWQLLAEVKDVGEKTGTGTSRAFRAPGPLRFHCDLADVLGLLCVRNAEWGGRSQVVSAAAIHNAMLERRPDLLEELYRPFCFSRQGEEVAGESPWYERPVFAERDGHFTSYFTRTFIESAQRIEQVPKLTERQQEALVTVSALADELGLTFDMEPGDIQLLNSHVTYHSRTDYRDHAEPERKRTLLRLWLATPFSRPLPREFERFYGSPEAGAMRGGLPHASGRRFAFDDWQEAGWTAQARADFGSIAASHPRSTA
jgi:hypothetical protein